MSYDVTREELAQTLAQERLNYVAMKRERDANWEALDRLRSRLREIVPDVPEGGDLVAAIQRKLSAPSPPETPAREGESRWPSAMVSGGLAAPLKPNCRCGEGVAGYTLNGVAHVSTGACVVLASPASAPTDPEVKP